MKQLASTTFNTRQQQAFAAMLEGKHVFLSGFAGTGKTTVMCRYREEAARQQRQVAFLATTGLAAVNIQGSTLHRFLGLPILPYYPRNCILPIRVDRVPAILATETVVIDEVSMLRSDLLAAVSDLLATYPLPGKCGQPFGGRQMIFVGDFCQLPPVLPDSELKQVLYKEHGGDYPFLTPQWQQAGFETVFLTEPHRQQADSAFAQALNLIRGCDLNSPIAVKDRNLANDLLPNCMELVNRRARVLATPPPGALAICMTNAAADVINTIRESEIPGTAKPYCAETMGDFNVDDCPTDHILSLKVGSRVMLMTNQPLSETEYKFVNGDLGTVTSLANDAVQVQLDNGRSTWVQWHRWSSYAYATALDPATGKTQMIQTEVGRFIQMPLRLAHAITVHKAQGLTLPRIHIDLTTRPFASSHLYVALSRARRLEDISLSRPIRASDIWTDDVVRAFDLSIRQTCGAVSPGAGFVPAVPLFFW